MFKSKFFKVLIFVVLVTLLASCSGTPMTDAGSTISQEGQNVVPDAPKSDEPEVEEPAVEPGKVYKVAFIGSLLGDRSFNDSAARGIAFAKEKYSEDVLDARFIENQDVGEQQLAAREMAEQGYDLIFTIGFGAADWTNEIAAEYPDTYFATVDAVLDVPNGRGLTFKEHEGSFTVGMVAALLTKTGKVGYVGGQDVPLLRKFELGYIEGVKYVDPDIEVVSGWVGSFSDANKGKELALTQYAEGADIIYAAAGKSGEGVLQASAEQDLFSIGVDSDQDFIQPGHIITSMLKRVDLAVLTSIDDLIAGNFTGGDHAYGLAENMVGATLLYSDDTIFLQEGPADMVEDIKTNVIPAMKAAVEKIKAGEFCVSDFMEVFPCNNPPQPGGMNQ